MKTEQVFNTLKLQLIEAPVLCFLNLNKPFQLETDASKIDQGAVFAQEGEDGKTHLIAYTSRMIQGAERIMLVLN